MESELEQYTVVYNVWLGTERVTCCRRILTDDLRETLEKDFSNYITVFEGWPSEVDLSEDEERE